MIDQMGPAFMIQNDRIEPDEVNLIPLEDIVRNAYSTAAVKTDRDKMAIDLLANDPGAIADPEKLAILQDRLGDYTIYISLVSTMARKATTTVETLIKAQ